MIKIKKLIVAGLVAVFAVATVAGTAFADPADPTDPNDPSQQQNNNNNNNNNNNTGSGSFTFDPNNCTKKYTELSTTQSNTFPAKCNTFTYGNSTYQFYGKTRGACASVGIIASDPESACNSKDDDLSTIVRTIINTVIFIVGILAVIMIILGGISYATSQGDSAKVKKGKDTILYGIVGLVICIFAYAIVQFVIRAVND